MKSLLNPFQKAIYEQLEEGKEEKSASLVTGAAGSGKTFLMRTIASKSVDNRLILCPGGVSHDIDEVKGVEIEFKAKLKTLVGPGPTVIIDDVFSVTFVQLVSLLKENNGAAFRYIFCGNHKLVRDDRVQNFLEETCERFHIPERSDERYKRDPSLRNIVRKRDRKETFELTKDVCGSERDFRLLASPKIIVDGHWWKETEQPKPHCPIMITCSSNYEKLYEGAVYEFLGRHSDQFLLKDLADGKEFVAPKTTSFKCIERVQSPSHLRGTTITIPVLVKLFTLPRKIHLLYETLSRLSALYLLYFDVDPSIIFPLSSPRDEVKPSPPKLLYDYILTNDRSLKNSFVSKNNLCQACHEASSTLKPMEDKPTARISDEGSRIRYLCDKCYFFNK